MTLRSFQPSDLPDIVECLTEAFKGYFVKLPDSVLYWENRLTGSRINWDLSVGVFDAGKLVAFILHGHDDKEGGGQIHNTGTGVIESHRGLRLVDQMYDYLIPKLFQHNVKHLQLEVIKENHRAIRVYERIGFSITRSLNCYGGILDKLIAHNISAIPIDLGEIPENDGGIVPCWDYMNTGLESLADQYQAYAIQRQDEQIGYVVLQPDNGVVARLYSTKGAYDEIFSAIQEITDVVKLNNIDSNRSDLIHFLEQVGINNPINQYEMHMKLQ